jgi:predicted negative regulator of RcsB-dependent stress response
MFELLNEAHALFQANRIGEAESLLLEALQEPDADTLSYLANQAVTYLQLIWITDESSERELPFYKSHSTISK